MRSFYDCGSDRFAHLAAVLTFIQTFKLFLSLLFSLKCHPALMVYRSSHFLLVSPPLLLLPDMGVSSSTVVSDRVMTHASILKAYLINQLPYWVTEQTNFGPAENPLAISINTDTFMNACMCTHTMKCRWRQMCSRTYEYKRAQSKQKTLNRHIKTETHIRK